MAVFTSLNMPKLTSLNGWWDFCACPDADAALVIPTEDWDEDLYMAPSSWTGRGSEAFGYPESWGTLPQGWLRRFVRVERRGNRRTILQFDGVGPRTTVFVNGAAVGQSDDGFSPFEVDITESAAPGVNELVLRVLDIQRDAQGRAISPPGRQAFAGIWQDARLLERSEIYAAAFAIETSFRNRSLIAEIELANATRRPRKVTVCLDVVAWRKTIKLATAPTVLDLGAYELEIPGKGALLHRVEAIWETAKLWSPQNPHLYMLRVRVAEDDRALYVQGERFGFREVWAEGPDLFLNGTPLRLLSDISPEVPALHHGSESFVRQWFEVLRQSGMNHIKLSGCCGTRLLRDLADEFGMLLTVESAIDGHSMPLASDLPDFWSHAANHVRRLVASDRNHPSIIMWSVARRVIQDLSVPSLAFQELRKLLEMVREMDSTRLAYLSEDGMHWSADTQALLDGPSGRFESIYDAVEHPRIAVAFEGDAEAERYINLARANGVAGVAVRSPLDACERLPAEDIKLAVKKLENPGIKLPLIPAGSAELNFWEAGKKTRPALAPAHSALAKAFRPVAVIDTTPATGVYSGCVARRRIVVCNDSAADIKGRLKATLRLREAVFASQTVEVEVPRGHRQICEVEFDVAAGTRAGAARLDYTLTSSEGRRLDSVKQAFKVVALPSKSRKLSGRSIAVAGSGALLPWLKSIVAEPRHLQKVTSSGLKKIDVLVMEPGFVEPGGDLLPELRSFVRGGGAVVLLEQKHALFHGVEMRPHSSWQAEMSAPEHPAFTGLSALDLICWDNRPIAGVVCTVGGGIRSLAEGDGGSVLFELRDDKGLYIATQLRILDALENTPAASHLLLNLLVYACARRTGTSHDSELTEGLFTPVQGRAGKGYPETLWLRNAPANAAMEAQMVAATIPANADYPPVQMFGVGDRWETVHRTNGWAGAATCRLGTPIHLFSRVFVNRPASNLHIEGQGSVEVTIGGRTYAAELDEETGAVIEGIELDQGYNSVLINWKPVNSNSRIRAIWCDLEGNPETSFAFV